MGNKTQILIMALSLFVSGVSYSANKTTSSVDKQTTPTKSGAEIALKRNEKPTSEWSRLKNKFFEIDYPKCNVPEASASGDASLQEASTVTFVKDKSCRGHSLDGVEVTAEKPVDNLDSVFVIHKIHESNLTINDRRARLFVTPIDPKDNSYGNGTFIWAVYLDCGRIVLELSYIQMGKSKDGLVEKGDYSIPAELKPFVSSLVCGKESISK